MKKLLFVALTTLVCFCISCNNSSGNEQGEKNIATVHAVNDAIESGDVSKVDQYIAADGVDHSGEHGEVKGIDSLKAAFLKMHSTYKDMKLEELRDAASGDYVFTLTRFTGTSTTASMGMPAGTSFDMTAVQVVKFNKDGKATDHWEYMTAADMMKMMGGEKNMGGNMENKADTSKKSY